MQYTLVIDQVSAVEWGLSPQEAVLFSFLHQVPTWANPVNKDGTVFYAISKKKIVDELPVLTDKPDTAYRILKSLQKKGCIELSSTPSITLVSLTSKGKSWNKVLRDSSPKDRKIIRCGSEENPIMVGEFSDKSVNQSVDHNHTPLPPEGDGESESSADKRATAKQVSDAYNEILGGKLPKCVALNEKRKRAIKRFLDSLKSPTEKSVNAYLRRFLKVARPFHFGENDRGWRADFDYVIKSDTVIKVREESL